jgi:hypothetical protein
MSRVLGFVFGIYCVIDEVLVRNGFTEEVIGVLVGVIFVGEGGVGNYFSVLIEDFNGVFHI